MTILPTHVVPMRTRYPRLAVMLLSLLCTVQARGDQAFIVGVTTHFLEEGGPLARPLRLMLEAGAGSVADEARWSTAEAQPGTVQIVADWPRYLDALQEKSLRSLLLLRADNPGYAGNDGEARAFGRYLDYLSLTFRGQVSFYELGDPLGSDDEAYVRQARDNVARLRRNDPQARILAGALSTEALDQGAGERLIRAGLLDSVDGLSLRPWAACRKPLGVNSPESWMRWLDEIDKRLTAQAGHAVPLYLTAMGWPSSQDSCGVSENTQGAYLARSFLLARSRPDIKGMWWHELADASVSSAQHPAHLGVLRSDLTLKPAYQVLKIIAPLLTRYHYTADPGLGRNNLYLMDFSNDDDHVLAAWAIGQARQIKIETRDDVRGPVQLIDTRFPERGRVDSDSHWVCQDRRCTAVITLSEFPQIISLGTPSWLFIR